jgi:diguanylate cyclase (GGDEF)-like protein/PAS domain S-box-containing protein
MKSKVLDYVDFEKANNLLEGFNQVTGFVTAILDLEGNVLSKSGWRRICTDFHRVNFESALGCRISDTVLANKMSQGEKFHFYECQNGLIDVAIPLIIRGEHIANLFTGQFFFEEPDTLFFKNQAKRYGFDEEKYLDALKKVPVVSREQVKVLMNFLKNITQMIIELTADKLDQLDLVEAIKERETALLSKQTQLIQSEERFANLFKRAPLGYQSLDENGNFLEVNEAWLSTLGYNYDEVIGRWFGSFLADEYVEPFRKRFPLFKSLGMIHSEFIMKHKDGTLKFISFEGRIGYKSDGTFDKTHCILQDITERKKIEEKIIESEQTYKALHEFSGVGIAYYSPDGHVISYNEKAAAHMGGTSADFAGKSLYELFPGSNADIYMDRIRKCVSSETPQNYDDLVEVPSGNIWFISTYTRILDASGNVKGVQIISQDISEIKNKEKKIEYLSYHDQLTGLYNRRFFEEELMRLDTARNLPITIAMGDVNGLKLVNDSFGHQTGDQLLIKVAETLKKACREDDTIARMGGDEFSILFLKTDQKDAEKIVQRINKYLTLEKIGPLNISVSIGFETKHETEENIEELIKRTEDHMYRHKLNDSASMRYKTINLIMATLLEKNKREQYHSERVSSICVDIASAMGFGKDEINHVKTAGLMHDIGKIGIDEGLLNSSNILSNKEWDEVKKHSEIGYRILSSSPEFSDIAEAVYSHHERWDGKGYPRGIKAEAITLYARIITIADAFDAMISERPYRKYRKSISVDEAINEIKKNAGIQFDPEIAKVFVEKVMNAIW